MSEGPWGQSSVSGDSGQDPKSHGVDELSRENRDRVQWPTGSTSCPRRLGPGSEARGVEQLSQETRAQFGGPAGSTNCQGGLGPVSDCLRGRAAVPNDPCQCPRNHGVDQLSWMTQALARDTWFPPTLGAMRPVPEVLRGRPAVTGDLGPSPSARGVDQLPRAARAWVGVSSGSRSCPR